MKVTFLTRWNGGLYFGGAEVQALQTASALQELGVPVEILHPFTREVGDIVHAFSSYREYYSIQHYCKQRGKKFILSTIFYRDISSVAKRVRYYLDTKLTTSRKVRRTRSLFRNSDLLLPNSRTEAEQVHRLFRVPHSKISVVPNGVEARFAQADPSLFRKETGIKEPFVLNVGRIEQRKNQLRLIQALRGTKIPLVHIGHAVDSDYQALCKEIAGDEVYFLPPIPHESPLLASAYSACRVFALPSILETPGLSALEAGVAGARIVVTPYGGAREYFGDFAFYPNPTSVKDIREAILQAWEATIDTHAQSQYLLQNFEWKVVAQRTLECYHRVLAES
ncbi:MAG: glycosyltransferase family 4 protein [Fimbriimonadales bacterium]